MDRSLDEIIEDRPVSIPRALLHINRPNASLREAARAQEDLVVVELEDLVAAHQENEITMRVPHEMV